jgi:hypothetical protein
MSRAKVANHFAAAPSGQVAAGHGDSGGSVFRPDVNPDTVLALGSISTGLGTQFDCTNDNGETTICSAMVGFVDEADILQHLGADLLTSN